MNYKACKSIKKKYRLWQKYRDSPDYQKYENFKRARNEANREIKEAKRKFEEKIARNIKEDSKTFFRYTRKNYSSREKIGPLKNETGEVVKGKEEMGEILNRFFASVFTREAEFKQTDLGSDRERKYQSGEMSKLLVTEEMVMKHLNGMKSNKAAGTDGLGSTFLKEVRIALSVPLCLLLQKSLDKGELPVQWKEANVTAIYKKKGKKSDPGNYRPVSLTSQLGKLCEKVIRDALVDHLEKNGLIRDSQHGFRKQKSCLTNLLEFLDEVVSYVDQGIPVDVIYLDFAKAFDKVPHKRLIFKLRKMKVDGGVVSWIENWLSGRRQRVVIDGAESGWEEVFSGVPQGSVLGPILFIVFINDIDDGVWNRILKFADDTKLLGRVDSEEGVRSLREDLKVLFDWSEEWQMLFNADKCVVMHFGFNNKREEMKLGDKVLGVIKEEKDLGVVMQDDLKVDRQCNRAASKANTMLGMIKRNFTCKSKEVIIPLYKTLVRPHMDYCVQAWKPHLRKDIERLEKIQRRATKMVEGMMNLTYEERLRLLGLSTFEDRMRRADLLEVFKIIKGLDKVDKDKLFTMISSKTRGNSLKMFKRRFRLDIGKFSFGNRVCDEWNGLPEEVVTAETLLGFKKGLDKHLRTYRGYF
jgi:hypothetical protein